MILSARFLSPRIYRYFSTTTISSSKKKSSCAQSKSTELYFGRTSSKLSAGIVGLANVGKSTLFQAITKSEAGIAANYPFATIKPEELLITIPSERLNHLQKIYKLKKQLRGTLKLVDIAGLTKGASQGKGLGNQFLNDIRQVDGILQVVRGFENDDITHIENNLVDPVRDLDIVNEELILKDLDFIETILEHVQKDLKYCKSSVESELLNKEFKALNKAQDILIEGCRISNYGKWNKDEIEALNKHNFLTAKPITYLLNVNVEDYIKQNNKFLSQVQDWIKKNSLNDNLLIVSADLESQLKELNKDELMINDNLVKSAIPTILQELKNNLNLISFFTCGDIEAREWPLRKNSTAPDAAAIIHTDLKKTFISADVIKYNDVRNADPETFQLSKLKSSGKISKEGKLYIIENGDIIFIKAGAGKKK